MVVKQAHYETLLSEYTTQTGAIALLKQYRPYLELLPSMRRPNRSIVTLPLPLVRVRDTISAAASQSASAITSGEVIRIPCEVALLMCDPEWKIKTGPEILIFIVHPNEDFSSLLSRWRQSQVLLNKEYEWVMSRRYRHILSEGAADVLPLFVIFPDTPERILRGLKGAYLPHVIQPVLLPEEEQSEDADALQSSSIPQTSSVESEYSP